MHSCIDKKEKFLEDKNDKKAQVKESYIWKKAGKSQGVSKMGRRIKDSCLKLVLCKDGILGENREYEKKSSYQRSPLSPTAYLSPGILGRINFY